MSTDRELRLRALDPRASFIVQAPAGSGKTELLIQRYLALLARVRIPEQVAALTFTRKAAAEMRRRVLASLEEARSGDIPADTHRRLTFDLARAVVAIDRELGWNVSLQPNRLRIETIDALNVRLAQHFSVLAGGVGDAQIVDDPRDCYELASRRTLASLGAQGPMADAVGALLRATDGNVPRLDSLLAGLLPTRDQWLIYLAQGDAFELRARLEQSLQRLIIETIDETRARIPSGFLAAAQPILRHAIDNGDRHDGSLANNHREAEISSALVQPLSIDEWRCLPTLFLTQKDTWRSRLTAREGFAQDASELKAQYADLIDDHGDDEILRALIAELRYLPSTTIGDAEWPLLESLTRVLKHLAAELKLIFAERGQADFVEVALAADEALGTVEAPSDLLLALDRNIQHLLVDEFQDTSHAQLRMLRTLTGGWEPGDGRTLFLVGDPMQSIYRFRHADMSLFLKVCKEGLGAIDLEPLTLSRNFRSSPAVVSWINESFAKIFPAQDDIGGGAAKYHGCQATRASEDDHGVFWHLSRSASRELEVERVANLLKLELARNPSQSIAVLVRSRSHLAGLQQQLRDYGLRAHAVELEPQSRRQIVQDLIGLTRALRHPADRIAWLGILRAPWCGLRWADLATIAGSISTKETVWVALSCDDVLAELTPDGCARASRLRAVITNCLKNRSLSSLDRWVEQTWLDLGGDRCLETEEDARAAEQFFQRLRSLIFRGDLADPTILEDSFADPYGNGSAPAGSGVEIMTIHRAKGLEFDSVVILGLGRQARRDDPKALYWLERTARDGSEDLLMAPLRRASGATETVAEFIRRADSGRDRAELARVLYVATTRARDRLHLVAQLRPADTKPPSGSLLEFLWDQAQHELWQTIEREEESSGRPQSFVLPLRRARRVAEFNPTTDSMDAAPRRPEFSWARHAAIQVGTLVHETLHEIAATGLAAWSAEKIERLRPRIKRALEMRGVEPAEIDESGQRVIDALLAVLVDSRAQWLLKAYPDAASELRLTIKRGSELEHLQIDRTFVDESDRRWIVDFKTSSHEGGELEKFLDSEVERYTDQLTRYASAVAQFDDREIWVGLYFPLLQSFRSWRWSTDSSNAQS